MKYFFVQVAGEDMHESKEYWQQVETVLSINKGEIEKRINACSVVPHVDISMQGIWELSRCIY